jgi:hypothetical protein
MKEEILIGNNIKKVFSNPFYCLGEGISDVFTQKHKALVSEEQFIKAGVNLIKEIGSEEYIKLLLENLKGNYI